MHAYIRIYMHAIYLHNTFHACIHNIMHTPRQAGRPDRQMNIYVCICKCMYMYTHTHIYAHIRMHTYVCTHTRIWHERGGAHATQQSRLPKSVQTSVLRICAWPLRAGAGQVNTAIPARHLSWHGMSPLFWALQSSCS
jgi:hypothetical protein